MRERSALQEGGRHEKDERRKGRDEMSEGRESGKRRERRVKE